MKKLLIFALCLLGICNARAEMMTAQEIILTEMATMQPWDSKDEERIIIPNHGNNISASSPQPSKADKSWANTLFQHNPNTVLQIYYYTQYYQYDQNGFKITH